MWGAAFSAVFLRERLSAKGVAGLVLGVAGVALIARPAGGGAPLLAFAAALAAAGCYAFIGIYLKRWAPGAPAKGLAVGTQLGAGLIVLPLVAFAPPAMQPSAVVLGSLIALGLVCGAIGYLLYFRLIMDLGATAALTVTYLTPLFAMLWGALFLGEVFTAPMLGGAALVIIGTVLVLRG
jgi:drug/metabolite transporter (DMT)-like permease